MDRVSALSTLEEQGIRMLLAGDDAILSSLRDQAEQLTVSSREMTGVGFFTRLVVSGGAATAAIARSFRLGDVSGTADGVMHGLGFLPWAEEDSSACWRAIRTTSRGPRRCAICG
jgi:hypothetical protein